ncbi:MAG: hypothetical protein IID40_10615 [Planctomycetes bacterium]|nr:hypothetical protein [Planctomycetota bacterium]
MAVACSMVGCIRGSLATSTGPNGPEVWSADNRQQAHVGEPVRFSFILIGPFQRRPLDPLGLADYCLVEVGSRRLECEPDPGGRFRFEYVLADAQPGEEIKVTVTAYRQYGQRDIMRVGDQWLRGDSPLDEPDRTVATDSLILEMYQTTVELELEPGAAPFDFESGKLELIAPGGTTTPVYIDRPGRPGFRVEGPDERGVFWIRYRPDGTQVGVFDRTEALFTVYDRAGQPHRTRVEIPTP